jgi:quinol monooxygenase YgiN
MDETNQHFSVGIWQVKPGKEYEFKAAFKEFADWVFNQNLGADEVYLLQDLQQPSHFITCGPWDSIQRIEEWRQLPEFEKFFIKARRMCDEATSLTMRPLVHLKR